MPSATLKHHSGKVVGQAGFQTPKKVADTAAWFKSALKALGIDHKTRQNLDVFATKDSLVFKVRGPEGIESLAIDRHYFFQLSGRAG